MMLLTVLFRRRQAGCSGGLASGSGVEEVYSLNGSAKRCLGSVEG